MLEVLQVLGDEHHRAVRVPDSARLGLPGQGLSTFFSTFNISRLGNASELIGLGRRALELGLSYAEQREVGDSVVTVAMIALVCPPVTSMTAGPEPRNGTWVRSMPATRLNSSAARCAAAPCPELA